MLKTSPEVRRLATVRLLGLAVGMMFGAQGIWAYLVPRSFFEVLATFEPYNEHYIRDGGSLLIAICVVSLLGSVSSNGKVVALGGLTSFQFLHLVSHVLDRDSGGRPGFDLPALASLTVLTAAALVAALRASHGPSRKVDARRTAIRKRAS